MKRARSQSGFTLLEVVVAFVVLSLVLTVVFEIFSTWLSRTSSLSEQSQALAIAQSRLAAVGLEEAVKEGEAAGESEDRRFRWRLRVERYGERADPSSPLQSTYSLYRAESSVAWVGADGKEHALSIANLQLGPRA
jgi:general secretion pathway protein I